MTSAVIETLRCEHKTLAGLLSALERQIGLFARGETPDYDIVRGAADYLLDYPDRCHHPKEDIVFARLLRIDAAMVGELIGEHRALHRGAERFAASVSALLNDAEIPRTTVTDAATSFIDAQRRHMIREEERFLPLADQYLLASDWHAIDAELARWSARAAVRRSEEAFSRVSEQLLAWQREDDRLVPGQAYLSADDLQAI